MEFATLALLGSFECSAFPACNFQVMLPWEENCYKSLITCSSIVLYLAIADSDIDHLTEITPSVRELFSVYASFLFAASKVDPLHLEYFTFAGRVIALALMHKVQVGIVFDRVFFQQLAGTLYLSLEDIRDADPFLYSSCKQILEMDADFIDSDALGLTFVREVEELGARKTVELCPGGKSKVVNSKNREEYVNYLIQHRFVTSISEQVSQFAQGFADILCSSRLQSFFFRTLELEDLDWMLHGSESAISVEDWKAHTEYNGYKETDPQILWFWQVCLLDSGFISTECACLLFTFPFLL